MRTLDVERVAAMRGTASGGALKAKAAEATSESISNYEMEMRKCATLVPDSRCTALTAQLQQVNREHQLCL